MYTALKARRLSLLLIAALLLLTAASSALHIDSVQATVSGYSYHVAGTDMSFDPAALPLTEVTGERVNGRGEITPISESGIEVSALLTLLGTDPTDVATLIVMAADSFSATVTGEELCEPGRVFLLVEGDGLRLCVFGDENSKRAVKDVVRLEAALRD